MKTNLHDRIESIAGAIALDEASDAERRAYREHIAACARCLHEFGGEHEIARVASVVSSARDGEVWQPNVRSVLEIEKHRGTRAIRYAVFAAVLCIAAIIAFQAFPRTAPMPRVATVAKVTAPRTVSARLAARPHPAVQPPAPPPVQQRLVVQHNIVHISRAPVPALAPPRVTLDEKPPEIAAVTVHAPPQSPAYRAPHSNVPVWRRHDQDAWRTVATTTTTSLTESAPQMMTHRAESIQLVPSHYTRDAAPLGGETAINPQPAMIAYDEGAQGTSVFEVLVDDRGNPTRCIITKSAGYAVLDSAVCRAAMQVRYSPKIVDGRAVAGAYHDAFTFRMSDNQDIEGIPKQIH